VRQSSNPGSSRNCLLGRWEGGGWKRKTSEGEPLLEYDQRSKKGVAATPQGGKGQGAQWAGQGPLKKKEKMEFDLWACRQLKSGKTFSGLKGDKKSHPGERNDNWGRKASQKREKEGFLQDAYRCKRLGKYERSTCVQNRRVGPRGNRG